MTKIIITVQPYDVDKGFHAISVKRPTGEVNYEMTKARLEEYIQQVQFHCTEKDYELEVVYVEPYQDLVDELFADFVERKKVFEREYDDDSVFKYLRWEQAKEALFIEQLDRLSYRVSKGEFPAEAIGEYVIAFFNAQDDAAL